MTQSSRERILVIDDENIVQLLLTNTLKEHGYEVTVAASLTAALEVFEPGVFTAALVDQRLPDGDGLDLLRKLRNADPEIELLVITAYASLESVIEAVKIGIFDYITKPFDHMIGVVQRINRAVEARRSRREHIRTAERLDEATAELGRQETMYEELLVNSVTLLGRAAGLEGDERRREIERFRALAEDRLRPETVAAVLAVLERLDGPVPRAQLPAEEAVDG